MGAVYKLFDKDRDAEGNVVLYVGYCIGLMGIGAMWYVGSEGVVSSG